VNNGAPELGSEAQRPATAHTATDFPVDARPLALRGVLLGLVLSLCIWAVIAVVIVVIFAARR
jgi:hypothetical protein